jgi:ribonuclease HII
VVVAGAVFEKGWLDPQVKDSKLLTHNKRVKAWNEVISKECPCYCVLSMPSTRIDELGIEGARRHLFEAVILFCRRRFPSSIAVQDGELVEVDGESNIIALPKADLLVPAVSAASIIAKVSRDLYMKGLARAYPHYGFETNVGYHSASHVAGLEKHGPCPEHRRSYRPLRKYC